MKILKIYKRYEYKDHLGNVRVVSNDIKSRAVSTVPFTTKIYNFANYYPFGMQQTGTAGSYDLSSDYRYGYNGKEKDDEIKGEANSLDYGARIYDPRVGRWMSTDPLESKYPSMSAYNYVANTPIMAINPDGKDIIILSDPKGAGGRGHQAVLISNGNGQWRYISKDGAENGGAYGKAKFTIKDYESIEEFANSEHNQVKADGYFKLDENGKRIQRYEQGYLIRTDPSTDPNSIKAATESATCQYKLGVTDCSHVVKDALDQAKTPDGKKVKNGEYGGDWKQGILPIPNPNYNPNTKQKTIEKENKGYDIDKLLKLKIK